MPQENREEEDSSLAMNNRPPVSYAGKRPGWGKIDAFKTEIKNLARKAEDIFKQYRENRSFRSLE